MRKLANDLLSFSKASLGETHITLQAVNVAAAVEAALLAGPMAVRTWEGSVAPEEQAEPLETARPLRSRAMTRASPSMWSK